jgi:hypothetical protein
MLADVGVGSFASIARCPPYVRLAGSFAHFGWLLIALDRQRYMPYWSSGEALFGAMRRAARFARGRRAGEAGGRVGVRRKVP